MLHCRNKLKFSLALALLLVSGSVSAVSGQRMVYGEAGRLDSYDPYTVHEASGQRLSDLIFDSLFSVSAGGEYVGVLAKKWQVGIGGTSVVVELRNNVHWHDSAKTKRLLTSKDVATTVRLLRNGKSEIPNKERFASIASVEVKSDTKLVIRLERAMRDPLRALMFKVLPDHHLGSVPALVRNSAFTRKPVGTGPYKLSKASAQGEVLLEANAKYFQGSPRIKRMVMKVYADQNIMAQSLMFNSIDLVTYVSPRDLPEIMGDRKLSVIPYDALSFTFFAMNTGRGVLKDRRVRQGIARAVNRAEMLQSFFGGKGKLITGPFPPTSWAYNIDVKPMEHDLAAAKQLFASAGLKDSDGDGVLEHRDSPLKLQFAVPMTGESETIKRIVLAFQEYLRRAGVSVELQFMDWLVWKRKVLAERDYDMTIASWSFDDSSNITSLFHSSSIGRWGNNFVQFRNQQVDSLLTEADSTSDFDKRRLIYHKLHAILAKEAPYTYLWTLMHHAAHNERIRSVAIEPFAFFKHVKRWSLKD